MKKVYVFLADGFEDVEALIPVDVWRRGGLDVTTVSIGDFPLVSSAHGVNIEADIMFEQGEFSDADLILHTRVSARLLLTSLLLVRKWLPSVPRQPSYSLLWESLRTRRLHVIQASRVRWQKTTLHILAPFLPSMAMLPPVKDLLQLFPLLTNCSASWSTSRLPTRLLRACGLHT